METFGFGIALFLFIGIIILSLNFSKPEGYIFKSRRYEIYKEMKEYFYRQSTIDCLSDDIVKYSSFNDAFDFVKRENEKFMYLKELWEAVPSSTNTTKELCPHRYYNEVTVLHKIIIEMYS